MVIFYVILRQLFDNATHDETPVGLGGVDPGLDINHLLFLVGNRPRFPALGKGYLEHIESPHSLSDNFLAPLEIVVRDLEVVLVREWVRGSLV